jgi:hypothetical protein
MVQQASMNFDEFDKEWLQLAEDVVKELMANSEIEKIKQKVRSQGHVGDDDRDQFIQQVNRIKYKLIHERYGEEDTENYKQFVKAWQSWHKLKTSNPQKPGNMFEENIGHLLFGSTPNPDYFLKDFDVNKDS